MNIQETLKPVARNVKKEWLSMDMEKVGASKHDFGIALKSRFQTLNDQTSSISALLTPGIQGDKHVNIVVDITLPKGPSLEPVLNSLSAFMQQATAVLSPMTVMVDMRTSQIVLRQSHVMPLNHPPATIAFVNAAQILVPLMQQTIDSLVKMNPAPNDAREMADLLAKSFYGALQE
ncbi:hypothetical protein [Parendozoicomonas haliclonae]|uniref:Uncharacterized protein n=1 Tax=Parendozoicomonas haliclonae TaxID=1960125 RepID=A0A1X7ANY4_9GAMM|nr:hypothetical protein [Parendozoicomonas haliclonae]SMA49808.1 hypothetical protein EHSB41UT_03597 [Parendozoicomonas haliclonae]